MSKRELHHITDITKKKELLTLFCTISVLFIQAQLVETRAYYSTNADNAVGKSATITIDGEFNDWNDSMIISTSGV